MRRCNICIKDHRIHRIATPAAKKCNNRFNHHLPAMVATRIDEKVINGQRERAPRGRLTRRGKLESLMHAKSMLKIT